MHSTVNAFVNRVYQKRSSSFYAITLSFLMLYALIFYAFFAQTILYYIYILTKNKEAGYQTYATRLTSLITLLLPFNDKTLLIYSP